MIFLVKILCVEKIQSRPRENLCVDKIGSRPPSNLCVDKITSRPRGIFASAHVLFQNWPMIAFPFLKSTNDWFSNRQSSNLCVMMCILLSKIDQWSILGKETASAQDLETGSSKQDRGYFPKSGPARTRRGGPTLSRRACTPHPPTLTHLHTHITIDFNTPRLSSFGKKQLACIVLSMYDYGAGPIANTRVYVFKRI